MLTFYSGGAKGVDLESEKLAEKYFPTSYFEICSFPGHSYQSCGFGEVMEYTYEQLHNKNLSEFIKQIAWDLYKRVPLGYSRDLIGRNFYQVVNSEMVIVIANLSEDKKFVQGGTGWTVQMAKEMDIPIYVYDDDEDWWFEWNREDLIFSKVDSISTFRKRTTIIGTRNITFDQKRVLEKIFKINQSVKDMNIHLKEENNAEAITVTVIKTSS